MEPGVPVALLGMVALLVTASWAALGAAAGVRAVRPGPDRRGGRAAAVLLAAGAGLLAYAEVRTALQVGQLDAEGFLTLRLVGAAVLVGALGAVIGLAEPQVRRSRALLLVAGGLLLTGATALLGLTGAHLPELAVLALRSVGALLLLSGLIAQARSSLLAKVVAAILAGVLVMAGASVGVVGAVVVRAYDRQASSLVEQAAQSRLQTLDNTLEQARAAAGLAQGVCARGAALCGSFLDATDPSHHVFAAQVAQDGTTTGLGGSQGLSAVELLGLAASCPVQVVLRNACRPAPTPIRTLPSFVRLSGATPAVAAVVVQAVGAVTATARPAQVFVYGVRIDLAYAQSDFVEGGYGFHLLALGRMVASDGPPPVQQQVLTLAASHDVAGVLAREPGLTVGARGSSPTVRFSPVQGVDGPVAVLAVSRDARAALATQQDALRALLLTAFVATAVAALFAVLLGRRTVDPVRRLTAAAERVSAGDLTGSAAGSGTDEVGTLSRTFDAMTGSLARLTDDLRASAAQLHTVLISISDGLVAADSSGRVTSINPAALAMVGATVEAAVLGRPLTAVLHLTDSAGLPLPTDGRRLYDLPAEVAGPHSRPVPVRAALTLLASGDGVVLVLHDTSREREGERMKTEFLSNVSHELRTPLTPIRGYAEMLATRPGLSSDQVGQFASTILLESRKMNRVVDLLVDVAALEAGRLTVEPRPVRAVDVVSELLAAWRLRVPERSADLRRKVASKLPVLSADPVWVAKALSEFLDNAMKYTPPGTAVTLGAALAPDGVQVRLYVRDDGPGIPVDKQTLLFAAFEQVDGSATRKVGGLGLGLSFVRRLAEQAGWSVSVTSTVGTGAVFALDLPVATTAVPPKQRAPGQPSPRQPIPKQPAAPAAAAEELTMAGARKAQIKKALLAAARTEPDRVEPHSSEPVSPEPHSPD